MTSQSDVDIATGEIAGNLQLSQRQAIGLLAPFCQARHEAQQTKRDQDDLGAQIRGYLEAHEGEELRDGELGITARLQPRRGAERFDVMSMPDELVLALKALSCLSIDAAALKVMSEKSIDAVAAMRFKMPGTVITALQVTEEARR